VVECLLCKCKVLNSNSSPTEEEGAEEGKERKEKEGEQGRRKEERNMSRALPDPVGILKVSESLWEATLSYMPFPIISFVYISWSLFALFCSSLIN
jgi:hypothetical protein